MKNESEKIAEVFDGYLVKPLNRDALLSELARFLPCETGIGKG